MDLNIWKNKGYTSRLIFFCSFSDIKYSDETKETPISILFIFNLLYQNAERILKIISLVAGPSALSTIESVLNRSS